MWTSGARAALPRKALARELEAAGLRASTVRDLEAAARRADVLSCATLAREPLLRGAWLRPGQHLDLVGAFTPAMREADADAVSRAAVFVDTEAALGTCGELPAGAPVRGTLAALCRGEAGRRGAEEVTLFKSVGTALADLAAASLAIGGAAPHGGMTPAPGELPSPGGGAPTTASDPRSHGLWDRTAPPSPDTPALAGELRADAVVVGAGYTGLSAALRLAEAGCRVAVLEGAAVGFGGSGRNVGLVNAGLWLPPDDVAARLGEEHGDRLLDLLGDAPASSSTWSNGTGSRAKRSAPEPSIARPAPGPPRHRKARGAVGGARGAGAAPRRGRNDARIGTGAYTGSLFDARAGTSSRSPTPAGWPAPRSPPGRASSHEPGARVRARGGRRPPAEHGASPRPAARFRRTGWSLPPTPTRRGRGRRCGGWSASPTSTSPPRRSATTPAPPCCLAARAPGTRGGC